MEKFHILITAPLEEADLERIAAVDPKVEVTYAMEEVLTELGITHVRAIGWGRPLWQRSIPPREANSCQSSQWKGSSRGSTQQTVSSGICHG